MKRILSMLIAVSVILSMITVIPALAETEDLKVYFYEDFVSGYKSGQDDVISLGVKRSLINGEYVYSVDHNSEGYETINFGTTVTVPDENKVVVEYKMSGYLYGGSNSIGFHPTSGIPTVYVAKEGIKAYAYTDKETIAKHDIDNGLTITVVYDNENPMRDIYIDNVFIGTYDMGGLDAGDKFCEEGSLPLNFYNHVHGGANLYYHYLKVYQAPSDYSPETFVPAFYKNIGKPTPQVAGVINYDDNFYFNVINALGFYNEGNIGEYKPDEPMTRLRFAGIIAEILNVSPVLETTGIYKDIARRHFMSGTLEALNQMGVMKGVGAEEFGKDQEITVPMVSAALVRALGYKEFAEYYSGYELGYVTMADKAGLLKGISQSGSLKSKDIIRILYNFMNAEVYETVGVSNNNYIKEATSGNTILKVYHNIASVRDIVKSNEVTSLTSKKGTDEDAVVIGNICLNTNGTSLNQYLGYSVEAYYNVEDETILFAGVTDKNNALVIDIDTFVRYLSEKITYEKDSKELTVSLSSSADIIYNGKFEPFSKKLFENIANGNITLIDNNNDNKYDVAFINSYINGVLDTKSNDGYVLRFKNNVPSIKLEDYAAYDIKDAAGKNVAFEVISENNVLSIQESKDKSYMLITVGTASTIGSLTEIYSDGRVTRLNIGGELIKADPVFVSSNSFLKPGITGEFFADAYGRIAHYSEITTRSAGYAYFIGMWDEGESYDYVNIKMFTEGKQLVELKTAKKVTIDGVAGVSSKTLMENKQLFNWSKEEDPNDPGTLIDTKGKAKPQLISYKLNSDGDIIKIDTPFYNVGVENPDNTLMIVTINEEMEYDSIDIAFGESVYLNGGCRVFTIPNENIAFADATEFDVKAPSSIFRGEAKYTISAYKTSSNTLGADILVTESTSGGSFDSYDHAYVVSDITDIWDEKEEKAIKKLSYFHDGKERNCLVPESSYLNGISKGDVVILSINSDNELTQAPKLRYDFDADTDGLDETVQVAEGNRGTIHRVTYGVIYELKGNLFTITKDPSPAPDADGNPTPVAKELHRIPTYIYIVDSATQKVSVGEKTDITDFVRDNINYTKAVFYETKEYDYDLVIIK
ncbi:MAG: hypothetical protein E7419_02460 [Ruminococcaceae bacterium]|nr:hypothetical protein [Oscillospiraceae bacterium]